MINGKRYCTINTDASYHEGNAGIAVWIVMDPVDGVEGSKPIRKFSQEKRQAADCNTAEILAFDHALALLIEDNYTTDVLVWNTDSQTGMDAFMQPDRQPKYKALGIKLRTDAAKIAPKFYAKKVKGHTNINKARNYVNGQLDRMASLARKKPE